VVDDQIFYARRLTGLGMVALHALPCHNDRQILHIATSPHTGS
jgi:hypothetical protein